MHFNPLFNYRGAKVKEKLTILKSLVEERERGNELAEAMAALHLPDTDAMEWNTKSAAMKAPDALSVRLSDYNMRTIL